MKSKNNKTLVNIFIAFTFFCFCLIVYRLSFLATTNKIDGINIKEFADERSIYKTSISAKRGTIYDILGNQLAENVASYKLIAYIDPVRSEGEKTLKHVKDKEKTAKMLATVIDMKYEDILDILNQDGLYQVEFSNAGSNLTSLEKEKIESFKLPGLDFVEQEKRYYPNGDFASYVLGYAKTYEDGKIVGEMGLESLLNDVLSGTDGYISYQQDANGIKIAGTKEVKEDASDGYNVYLTIDSNIQFFVEQAIKDAFKNSPFEWMVILVADAKTGKILASSQSPSFDPNTKDIKNWVDYSVAQAFEPGSIMKIYTYMAAMENGTYDGSKTFASGHYTTEDGYEIYDWRRWGFGQITYDQGFLASSNTGVIGIMNNFIDKKILQDYFKKMGFGVKTKITLPNEVDGSISFRYQTEVYNAAFGQGVTTTPMQHIQALTAVANDGVMLSPYIIDKVTDVDGNIVYQGKKTEIGQVASHETISKIRNLMYDTVNSDWEPATGRMYKLDGYNLIGKTGTAQLANDDGSYYTSDYYSTKSFVGMWPKDDPEVIILASVRKPQYGSSAPLVSSVKSIVQNVSKYLEIYDENDLKTIESIKLENYRNKNYDDMVKKLSSSNIKVIKIGDGNKIINQYPSKDTLINVNDKVILFTNSNSYSVPDFTSLSRKEALAVCNMLEVNCIFNGNGYVDNQNVGTSSTVTSGMEIILNLKNKY